MILVYLELLDVARLVGLSRPAVRLDVASGRLRAAARTPRGVNLYAPADVANYLADRAARLSR